MLLSSLCKRISHLWAVPPDNLGYHSFHPTTSNETKMLLSWPVASDHYCFNSLIKISCYAFITQLFKIKTKFTIKTEVVLLQIVRSSGGGRRLEKRQQRRIINQKQSKRSSWIILFKTFDPLICLSLKFPLKRGGDGGTCTGREVLLKWILTNEEGGEMGKFEPTNYLNNVN